MKEDILYLFSASKVCDLPGCLRSTAVKLLTCPNLNSALKSFTIYALPSTSQWDGLTEDCIDNSFFSNH